MNKENGHKETDKQILGISLENLGTVNKNLVRLRTNKGNLTLWFSYETIVGFAVSGGGRYLKGVIQNYWSGTTGKLLNQLEPDKKLRLEETNFKEALSEAFRMVF